MATLLEDGRVVDDTFTSRPFCRELVNGAWVEPSNPVSASDLWFGRKLSDAEFRSYIDKSGSPN